MLVDPLQPIVPTPTGWMTLQADQHRHNLPLTPGLTGLQPRQDWLSQLVEKVRLLVQFVYTQVRTIILSLSDVSWIQEKTGIAPPCYFNQPLSPLGGVQLNTSIIVGPGRMVGY